MGGRVAELRAERGVVRAALELKDAFPANLRSALEERRQGGFAIPVVDLLTAA